MSSALCAVSDSDLEAHAASFAARAVCAEVCAEDCAAS
jgi:hypothetical protein